MIEKLITKVGVVPFCDAQGERHFLLHKPKPKHDPTADIPYGLCRGTRRYENADGALVDLRDPTPEMLQQIDSTQIEPFWHTARQEAWEELGLTETDFVRSIALGAMEYDSPNKPAYPVFWFAVELQKMTDMQAPEDAAAVRWVTLQEAQQYAQHGTFKQGYLAVLERVRLL